MTTAQIHFELYVRVRQGDPWVLRAASETKTHVVESGEELIASGAIVAYRLTREAFDDESREFRSVTLVTRGADADIAGARAANSAIAREGEEKPQYVPICSRAEELYTPQARARISRLLGGWLTRKGVTLFELMHRADLAIALDSGQEGIQAIQRVAVAENQSNKRSVHKTMRELTEVVDLARARLKKDSAAKRIPVLTPENFAEQVMLFADAPDGPFLIAQGLAGVLAACGGWDDKLDRLLDLADSAFLAGDAKKLAMTLVQEPLAEIIASHVGLSEIIGREHDLGAQLAVLGRIVLGDRAKKLLATEPHLAELAPPLSGTARRLGDHLKLPDFAGARSAVVARMRKELASPKRLRPDDADQEIEVLRLLALMLAGVTENAAEQEEMLQAFCARSRTLLSSTFIEAFLAGRHDGVDQVKALLRLAENITGEENRIDAGTWLASTICALKFERDLLALDRAPSAKLAELAALQKSIARSGLPEGHRKRVLQRIGEVASQIEERGGLIAQIGRSDAPPVLRLIQLLRMACGETAPLGPAADRARAAAMKIMRTAETKQALASSPSRLETVRELLDAAAGGAAA